MLLVEYDDVIEAFPAYAAVQSLDVRILPRGSWGSDDFLDAHVFHTFTEIAAVDSVTISEQEARGFVIGKCFNYLLRCPLGRRVRRDVEVNDFATIVSKHDKAIQDTERSSRHGEKIDGYDVANMVVQEGSPRL